MAGRYCVNCLYDLGATVEPRCPECGRAFNPRNTAATTLKSNSVALWALHHLRIALPKWTHRRREQMFCRECWTDLRPHRAESKCPVCDTWFDAKEEWTFRRSDHALARVYERFRHVCILRGVLLAGLLLGFGLVCFVSGRALLPGGGRPLFLGARRADLAIRRPRRDPRHRDDRDRLGLRSVVGDCQHAVNSFIRSHDWSPAAQRRCRAVVRP